MLVRLEVTAAEKVALRSQYEPNSYSVLVSVENLEIQHPDEIQAQAETLFRRAKDAIETAKRQDGVANKAADERRPQASQKQVELIQQLAKRAGLDRQGLRDFAVKAVGSVDDLSRFDASRLINALQHVSMNGRAS